MLPIHEHIVGELVQEDGVVVIGAGIGFAKLLASLLRLHSPSEGVVFVLSASEGQRAAIKEELLEQDSSLQAPIEINNEYTASDRLSFYARGGVAFITSRILIVDLLNERVPLARVSGLVFLNAHRLSDTCTEAFIARLYRVSNRKGFIRAFSDKPQAMISGFSKTERIMRSLFVRRLHLWPRFHMSIASALEENPPQVVDLRVPFTGSMHGIHAAILEVMDACLKELKKTNKLDVEDLTIENGLFKSFDEIVRRQLDPIWHTLSRKIKQLVSDLKTLRKLADYLLRYDAITFLKYLDTLRASEDVRSVWIFANPTHKIFELAKRRVFQVVRTDTGDPVVSDRGKRPLKGRGKQNSGSDMATKKRKANDGSASELSVSSANAGSDQVGAVQDVEVVVMAEEMPKWKVLHEVLGEIQEELQGIEPADWEDDSATVLIACKDERTCLQLQDCVNKGAQKLMGDEWEKYLLGKAELHGMRTRKKRTYVGSRGVGVLNGKLSSRNVSVEDATTARQEEVALLAAAAEVSFREEENRGGRGRGRGRGRSRGAGSGKRTQKEKQDAGNDDTISLEDPSVSILLDEKNDNLGEESALLEDSVKEVSNRTSNQQGKKSSSLLHFYAIESEQRILDILRPSFVIVYDPDMAFVREMEVYKAEHPLKSLKVYFLFYDNSTEAQKFEASIRRENSAFESLIRQKASMMIPVDQDGRLLDLNALSQSPSTFSSNSSTRKAGGRKASEKQMKVVVDMREFGSSLPCVLHQQGIKIVPVTLEVGDYILSPDICVERKSVADLFQSFASGRLYHQAETMTRYYRIPVLLIEFSQDKSFSFQSANEVGEDILPTNIVSRLSLLVLHFPRLRVIWSRSLHATADIFLTLKSNQDEPDVDKAMRVGVPTEDGLIEGDLRAENYNSTAVELLRRLPGVTDANYRSLMDGCNSLAELACVPMEKLSELMGGNRPARMLRDFLDAKCPTLA
ncbi:hypothetical protein GOP47_0019948 [Adiantum capillus-veneris]|uniref:ERCC4 domain-containing protein n=1 Tax=Adiantum capillus-veneris TaxID=13818 RepID=A0A9D4UD07_ADICA|nr:hypothetical protein GOP47_0019948 [Adiantum capillus-veneris]